MSFWSTIITGFLAGWIAGILAKGKGMGLIGNVVMGMIGAIIGRYVLGKFDIVFHGFWGNVATGAIGATLLLFLIRIIKKL